MIEIQNNMTISEFMKYLVMDSLARNYKYEMNCDDTQEVANWLRINENGIDNTVKKILKDYIEEEYVEAENQWDIDSLIEILKYREPTDEKHRKLEMFIVDSYYYDNTLGFANPLLGEEIRANAHGFTKELVEVVVGRFYEENTQDLENFTVEEFIEFNKKGIENIINRIMNEYEGNYEAIYEDGSRLKDLIMDMYDSLVVDPDYDETN